MSLRTYRQEAEDEQRLFRLAIYAGLRGLLSLSMDPGGKFAELFAENARISFRRAARFALDDNSWRE